MKAKIMAMMLGIRLALFEAVARLEPSADDLHQVWEDNHVLKLARQPYQIQRILIDRHFVGQCRRVVAAEPGPAVRVDADAEVAHASLQVGGPCDVLDGRVHVVVDLGRVRDGDVMLVVE